MSLSDLAWLDLFPPLNELGLDARELLTRQAFQKQSHSGDVAYREGDGCQAYVLRLAGWSRVQKTSESGREIVLYRVGPNETCVLTTSCLLGKTNYPAESIVEADTQDVFIPAPAFQQMLFESDPFRRFVLSNYGKLIGDLMVLIDEVTFKRVDVRLARWLSAESGEAQAIEKTHQRIAVELGSAREVISRLLKEFERKGFVKLARGRIEIENSTALKEWGDKMSA